MLRDHVKWKWWMLRWLQNGEQLVDCCLIPSVPEWSPLSLVEKAKEIVESNEMERLPKISNIVPFSQSLHVSMKFWGSWNLVRSFVVAFNLIVQCYEISKLICISWCVLFKSGHGYIDAVALMFLCCNKLLTLLFDNTLNISPIHTWLHPVSMHGHKPSIVIFQKLL